MERKKVLEAYNTHREEIKRRIKEFKQLRGASEQRLFLELVFVILTSNTGAREAWNAARKLEREGLLDGPRESLEKVLENFDIRYGRRKAGYIVEAREELSQPTLEDPSGRLKISDRIDPERLEETRENMVGWPGLGWKGASHFLRNIGRGNGFAIVSGPVSKALYSLGLSGSPEPPASRQEYLEAERKIRELAEELGMDTAEMDLAIWSLRSGEVFK